MTKEFFYRDNVFSFEGAVSAEQDSGDTSGDTGGEVTPWRIDFRHQLLFPVLKDDTGRLCSGVRLCFTTDSKTVVLKFGSHDHEVKLDIFIDDKLHEKITMEPGTQQAEIRRNAGGEKKYCVWLDHRYQVHFHSILTDSGAIIKKTPVTQKRWVHYGSSISQAAAADSPSDIWPAIAARNNNLHLTNLGFVGQCKIEPMMAFVIRDLPADFITLKLGINLYLGDLTHRTFLPAILGFVKIIRDRKPYTPITLISPIFCPPRENVSSAEGQFVFARNFEREVINNFNK
ncbi:MAG: hypothetical protein FWD78_11300 [Treponema sp.]|nr:hypothetical protein [Treponema sp.]